MSALEHEIIEKFQQLDKNAQKRVRALIELETDAVEQSNVINFDYAGWFRDVEALRQRISDNQSSKLSSLDVVGILRDIRDGDDE